MAHARTTTACTFDSADLSFFDSVLDSLVEELTAASDTPVTAAGRDALKRRLGEQLFADARSGERDAVALRQRLLENLFSGEVPLRTGSPL